MGVSADEFFSMGRFTGGPSGPVGPVSYDELAKSSFWTPPAAKIHVDEQRSLNFSAVFRCVALISQTVAILPWRAYERTEGGRQERPDHPVDILLHRRPNPEMHAKAFKETLMGHRLTWGNGFAEIERARNGDPLALWPIDPARVSIKRTPGGDLYYEVNNTNKAPSQIEPADMFHLRGLTFDGILGYSPVRLAREAISAGLAMEQFAGAFFGNGARLSGVLEKKEGAMSDDAYKRLKESFDATYSGSANANKTALLEEGVTYKQISVPPEDAQFLESRQFQVTEICRWFGVPPHKLGELSRATFSNIEHQSKEYVDDCILPQVSEWEAEAQIKLFRKDEAELYTRMNLNALLRGDSKARGEYYKARWSTGSINANEIRVLEDENPIGANGDLYFVPMNHITLENARENKGKTDKTAEKPQKTEENDE